MRGGCLKKGKGWKALTNYGTSCRRNYSTGLTRRNTHSLICKYGGVCIEQRKDNQVFKLFALTGETATWGMLAIP